MSKITQRQRALEFIQNSTTPVSISDIHHATGIPPHGLSTLLTKMYRSGEVERCKVLPGAYKYWVPADPPGGETEEWDRACERAAQSVSTPEVEPDVSFAPPALGPYDALMDILSDEDRPMSTMELSAIVGKAAQVLTRLDGLKKRGLVSEMERQGSKGQYSIWSIRHGEDLERYVAQRQARHDVLTTLESGPVRLGDLDMARHVASMALLSYGRIEEHNDGDVWIARCGFDWGKWDEDRQPKPDPGPEPQTTLERLKAAEDAILTGAERMLALVDEIASLIREVRNG